MCLIALGIIAPKEVSFALGLILCLSPQLVSSSLRYSLAAQIAKPMEVFRLKADCRESLICLDMVWKECF